VHFDPLFGLTAVAVVEGKSQRVRVREIRAARFLLMRPQA